MRSAAAAVLALCVATPLAVQTDIGSPPGALVDVGGRKLHLLCSGAGAPTIVLEAGASAFSIDWTLVQRELAPSMRVCAYDRAGSAWSDPRPPDGSGSIPHDLHELLERAGERGPFVMVGASFGGLLVREYAEDYPTDVAAIVLVDPASEDRLFTMHEGRPVLIASLTSEQLRSTFPQHDVAVRRRAPQTGAPFDLLPADRYTLRIALDRRLIASIPDTVPASIVARSQQAEHTRLVRLLTARQRQDQPLGDRPLIVLTRGVDANAELRATHAALAALSSNGKHRVVDGAGHEIHLYRPGLVAEAVREVVMAIPLRTARGRAR